MGPCRELSGGSDARHLERFALCFRTTESEVFDRQWRQIVQSGLNLDDSLP